jgi:tagaturonate reductase
MDDESVSTFISTLMLKEIAPAIPYPLDEIEANEFGLRVLDRFRNGSIEHQWISITMQYSSKMAKRTIPLLLRYYELFHRVPPHFVTGFSAFLLFMRPVKIENGQYFGRRDTSHYIIKDDRADYFYKLWHNHPPEDVIKEVLQNKALWETDLTKIDGLEGAVRSVLSDMLKHGVKETLLMRKL